MRDSLSDCAEELRARATAPLRRDPNARRAAARCRRWHHDAREREQRRADRRCARRTARSPRYRRYARGLASLARLPRAAVEGDRVALYRERFGTASRTPRSRKRRTGWLVELYPGCHRAIGASVQHAAPQLYELRKHGIVALCEQAIAAVQRETGFDKVMACRFREDWSGEVLGGSVARPCARPIPRPPLPASDIPKIARDLYLKNPSRLIADVHSATVPIVGQTARAAGPDLLRAAQRLARASSSTLRNMQVGASCSFASRDSRRALGPDRVPSRRREDGAAVEPQPLRRVRQRLGVRDRHARDRSTHAVHRPHRLGDRSAAGRRGRQRVAGAACCETRAATRARPRRRDGAPRSFLATTCVRLGVAPNRGADPQHRGAQGGRRPVRDRPSRGRLPRVCGFEPDRIRRAGRMRRLECAMRGIGPRFVWFRPEERSSVVWAGDPNKGVEWRNGVQVDLAAHLVLALDRRTWKAAAGRGPRQDLVAAQKFRTSILRWTVARPMT